MTAFFRRHRVFVVLVGLAVLVTTLVAYRIRKQQAAAVPRRQLEIVDFLRPRLAKWALPDAVEIIAAVPKTSVGKFDKKILRERFKDWQLPA